jgi:hypothetical protein
MHLLHSIAIQPNLELKTQPKELLGSLPLDFALTDLGLHQASIVKATPRACTKKNFTDVIFGFS